MAPVAPARRWPPDQRWAVAAVFIASGFVTIMDGTIVNVALPAIGRGFGVAPTSVGVVVIGYMVAMGSVVPIAGWLAHRLGAKRVLLGALLAFTLASVLCGLAANLEQLALLRIVQGLGGGMLAPVGLAMLYQTFPHEERLRVSTFTMVPTLLAPATGPVLGGLLVSELSWRCVFFVNVPIGLAALGFGLRWMREIELADRLVPLDLRGLLFATVSLAMLMFGLAEGPDLGWGDPIVLATALGGAVLLVVTIGLELRTATPLLAVRLLTRRRFRCGSGIVATTGAAFVATLFAVSLYFQYGRGLSPLTSGLSSFPEAVGVLCGGQLASRVLHARLGARRLITIGVIGSAVTMALLASMGAHTSLWLARAILFVLGLSTGQIFAPTQIAAFAEIDGGDTALASTLFTVVRQLSGAVAIALLAACVGLIGATGSGHATGAANLTAYRWPFVLAAALALCGLFWVRGIGSRAPLQTRVRTAAGARESVGG